MCASLFTVTHSLTRHTCESANRHGFVCPLLSRGGVVPVVLSLAFRVEQWHGEHGGTHARSDSYYFQFEIILIDIYVCILPACLHVRDVCVYLVPTELRRRHWIP